MFTLQLLLIVLGWIISIVMHELGHVAAVKAFGFKLKELGFGIGRRRKFKIKEAEITFGYPWTLSMAYVLWTYQRKPTITQRFIVVAAGPLVNAVLLSLASFGDANWHDNSGLDLWGQFGAANFLLLIAALFPARVPNKSYPVKWTDGAQMLGLIQEKLTGKNFTLR